MASHDTMESPSILPTNSIINEFDDILNYVDKDTGEKLLRGIYSMGFEVPSPIQSKGIIPLIMGDDLIAQAQSGTGKTATFLIGSLAKVDPTLKKPQLLILCPNRELAEQIYYNFEELNKFLKFKGAFIIGGKSLEENFRDFEAGAQVIIGTPGRVYDMMKRSVFKTEDLKCFIMDEADEMLSQGFKDQVYDIFQTIPLKCQVCVFSATMPEPTLELTRKFMTNPTRILVKKEQVTLDGIKQFYVGVEQESWKLDILLDLYDKLSVSQTIIFVNSKRKAIYLKEQLEKHNFTIGCIHADLSQVNREKIMKSFRKGDFRILIGTDIIARGLDIQQISAVINFEVPRHCETYVHRVGRCGRFGRHGTALNIVTHREFNQLERIKHFYHTEIDHLPSNVNEIFS